MAHQNPMQKKPSIHPNLPIGLFDSGVGGLTVLDCLLEVLPKEQYVYFGDTLHMPYGSKSFEEIRLLVDGILHWMCEVQQVKLVTVACNTSAGVLYDDLAQRCPVPLIEPITPVCQWLATDDSFRKVGLIATPTTVRSNRYGSVLEKLNPAIALQQVPCDGLARMIESGETETEECEALLRQFLEPLVEWGLEALILGCTHYPHAAKQIQKILPAGVHLIDPATLMAQEALQQLGSRNLINKTASTVKVDCYVSQNPLFFKETSQRLPLRHAVLKETPKLALMNTHRLLNETGTVPVSLDATRL